MSASAKSLSSKVIHTALISKLHSSSHVAIFCAQAEAILRAVITQQNTLVLEGPQPVDVVPIII
jgi:hypothetical protein